MSRFLLCALLACRAEAAGDTGEATPPEPARPPPPCSATTPGAVAECVSGERVRRDIEAIAGNRPPGSAHWREVQTRCADTFDAMGYEVELHKYATGVNVVGTKEGKSTERVVIGAHYDHIPGCEGADDNASGTAGVLELARVLAGGSYARTLVVACWDEEERGLIGSKAWASQARARGDAIALYLNFDAIAYTDDEPGSQSIPAGFDVLFGDETRRLLEQDSRADFIAVIADARARPFADVFAAHAEPLQLPHAVLEIPQLLLVAPLAVDLRRSDHASFWDQDVPALMLTDTANFRSPAYHCKGIADSVGTLDVPFAVKVVRAAAATTAHALGT